MVLRPALFPLLQGQTGRLEAPSLIYTAKRAEIGPKFKKYQDSLFGEGNSDGLLTFFYIFQKHQF